MFGWELPPHNSGGLGTACLGLTQGLASLGVEIDFVLPKNFGSRLEHMRVLSAADYASLEEVRQILGLEAEEQDQITRSIGYGNYLSSHHLAKQLKEDGLQGISLSAPLQANWYAYLATKISKERDFDLIHCHDWFTYQCGIAAREVARAQGQKVPFIAHVHATEIDRSGGLEGNPEIMHLEKVGLQQADHVVTVSNYTKELIQRYYQVPEEKISVVHNGLPLSYSPPRYNLSQLKKKFKIVLFMGRITMMKGPDYFIRLAKLVTDQDPSLKFVMVGSGDMEKKCIEQAAAMGLTGKMLFSSFLRGKDVERAYQLADLFVMPSISEPFGLVALESIQNGTPVIISKQAGVAEVLPNLRQIDFWDTEKMSEAVLDLLYQPHLSRNMVREGKRNLKLATWKHAAQKLQQLYFSLSQGRLSSFAS